MAVNAISYVKNVGKSFGYAAVDYFNSKNPAVKAVMENSKQLSNELYENVKDFKEKIKDPSSLEDSFLAEPIGLAKEFYNNLIEDVKNGTWYNKARNEKVEDEMIGNFMGDFDNFDFDDDFNFDDDFDDDKSDSSDDIEFDDLDFDDIDTVGKKVSEAVSMATAKSAHYIVTSSKQNTKVMLEQNNKLFYQVNNGLAAINSNISSLVKLGSDINTHIQNSSVFYTKSTELQTKQVSLLEQLVKNTSPISKKDEDKGTKYKRFSDILGDEDVLDFQEYIEAVKFNIKNSISAFTGLGDMFKDENGKGDSIFRTFISSPLQMVMEGAMSFIVPKVLEESMEAFNQSLSGFFGSLILNLNKASGKNIVTDTIIKMLGIRNGLKNTIDTSLYEKGKVDFDGITRKSIVEVIPTYLSKILSAVSGKEEIRYDFQKGSFRTYQQIKQERDDITRGAAKSAGYDLLDEFRELIKEDARYSDKDKEKMIDQVVDFLTKSVEKGQKFNYRQPKKLKSEFEKFGLDENIGNMIVDILYKLEDENKGYVALNLNKEIALARDRISDNFRSIERNGDNIINSLYNGSMNEKTLTSSPLNLNNIYDDHHNNIFYYLQGIYQHTQHLSDNIENLGGGGAKSKGKAKGRQFTKIKEIIDNTPPKVDTTIKKKEFTEYEYDEFIKDINETYLEDRSILPYTEYLQMTESEKNKYIADITEAKRKTKEGKDKIKEIKESANDKISKIVEGITKLFNKPVDLVNDILNKANKVMLDIIYGKPGEEDKGILGYIMSETKELFSKFGKWIDENIMDKFGWKHIDERIDEWFGEKGKDGKRHGGKFGEIGGQIADKFSNAGEWIKDSAFNVAGSVKDFFTGGFSPNAYRGGNVEKTGLVAVSEGEMIIPSELNPFYKGKTDKKKQARDENDIVKRFFGKFNTGTEESVGEDAKFKEESTLDKTTKSVKGAINKFVGTKEDPGFGRKMASTASSGLSRLFDEVFEATDEDSKKKHEQIKSTMNTVLEQMGVPDNISSTITGGLIGGGLSLLTGGIISPILGAAIGSGAGLITSSKSVQEALFGTEDKYGLLPEDVSKFIQNNFPQMAQFGTIGGLAGLLGIAPGGPVGGLLLGAGLGFATKSQKVHDFLLGSELNEGLISKELQKKIKEAAPSIGLGALGGLIAGPFGLVGNLMVGSAIGYVASTEEFKDKIFGTESEDGLIKTIKKSIIKPLTDAIESIAHEFKFQAKNLFKGLARTMNNAFNELIYIHLKKVMNDTLMKPLVTAGKAILSVPLAIGAIPFKGLTMLGSGLKAKQIKKGQASYMTAKQRLNYRNDYNMGTDDEAYKFDELIAGMDSQDLSKLRNYIQSVQNPTKDLQKQATNSLNNISSKLAVDNRLSTKEIWNITNLVKKGNTEQALKDFDYYINERGIKAKDAKQLRDKIFKDAQDFNNFKAQKAKASDYVAKQINQINKEYGLNITEKNAWKYEDLIKKEIKSKDKISEESPEFKLLKQNKENHKELIGRLDVIINRISRNGEPLKGTPIVDTDINKKVADINGGDESNINMLIGGVKNNISGFNALGKESYLDKLSGVTRDNSDLYNIHFDDFDHIPESVLDGSKKGKKITKKELMKYKYENSKLYSTINKVKDKFRKNPMKKCIYCGNKIEEDSVFCSYCGTPVGPSSSKVIDNYIPNVNKLADDVKNNIAGLDTRSSYIDKLEGNKSTVQYVPTATGELVKHVLNGQGEPIPDNTDQNAIKIIAKQKEVQEAHINTAKSLGGLGGTLSSLFSKLFKKDEEDEKPSLLEKIKEKLTESFDKTINFLTGGGLATLFTGIVDAIIAGITIKGFLGSKTIQDLAEKILNIITGGEDDEPDNAKGGNYQDKRTKKIDIDGKTYTVLLDKNGNPQKDADGNYIDANGNVIQGSSGQWVSVQQSGRTLQSRLIEDSVRGVVGAKVVKDAATGKITEFKPRATVAGVVGKRIKNNKIVSKAVSGAKKAITKVVGEDVAEVAANQGLYKSFMKMVSNALEKIPLVIKKIPFLGRFSDKADDFVTALYTHLDDVALKAGSKLGSLASSLSSALGYVKIAFMIADFYTGYQDARTTLGIVEKPTESQRIISGLIRLIKNLIPIIGALIPDKALVSLFVNRLAPILGIDTTDIKRQRDEAKILVSQYNERNGTDYTIEDYNKKVLNDYTATEKVANFAKSVKANIKEKGFVGAIKSGAEEYVENAKDTFNKNYEEGGIIPAIAETLGSLFPGYIGDGLKGTQYMADMALKGDVKGVVTYSPTDKDDSVLTKILGQASIIVTKIPLTGVALITAGVRKVLEVTGLDEKMKSLASYGSDIASMVKYALTGQISEMSKVGSDNGNEDEGPIRVIKKIATFVPKIALALPALLTTGVRKVIEGLNLDNMEGLSNFGRDAGNIVKYAFTGEYTQFENVTNSNASNDSNIAYEGKIAILGVLKTILLPVVGITTGVRAAHIYLSDKIKSISNILSSIGSDAGKMIKYSFTGNYTKWDEMYTSHSEGESDLARDIKNFSFDLVKGITTPFIGITHTVKCVSELVNNKILQIKNAANIDLIKAKVQKAETFDQIWAVEPTVEKDNGYYGLNVVALRINQATSTITWFFEKIADGIKDIVGGIKEKMSEAWNSIEKFIDDPWSYVTEAVSNSAISEGYDYFKKDVEEYGLFGAIGNVFRAKGSGLKQYVGGNSGFVSQLDPRYANTQYGSSNVGQEGCGPAVATMAVNNALGGGNVISMKDSMAYAKRHNYEQSDGTSADYFGDMFNQYGLQSEYTRNINGSKSKDIEDKLASGSSVVLLGQDRKNTSKSNSPFGPNNHYVLATGMDDNGNVVVNDPELNGPTTYNKKILDNANLAIATNANGEVASGSRIGKRITRTIGNRFKVYTGGASSAEKIIFNFLTDKTNGLGLNSAAACGILANIQKESGFRTGALGDSGTSYGICQWHNTRYTNLKNWCSKNGYDYTTLDGQLRFLEYELKSNYKGMLEGFRKVANTAQGAYQVGYDWCYKFERPANKAAKSVERGNLAKNTFFPKYKGQVGKYDKKAASVSSDKMSTSSTSTTTNTTSSEDNQTPFAKLTSMFGGLMGDYFGRDNAVAKLFGFADSSSDSGSDSLTTYEGVAKGGPGNDKQKALVSTMKSKLGKLTYSMNGPRNPDMGSADCSSTINWAYKKVYGKDVGNSTLAMIGNNNTKVVQIDSSAKTSTGTTKSKGPKESGLQPGDLLLYSRPTSSYTKGRQYRIGHVEMYAGDGKRIGHGGPGMGPNLTPLTKDSNRFVMAKRLKDIGSGSGIYGSKDYINTIHEKGSIVDLNKNKEQRKLLRDKTRAMSKAVSAKGSVSDDIMITLVKSIVSILTTMANNSNQINTIVELLQNYFNAKNNTTNKTQTKSKSASKPNTTELDVATKELVDYLNSLAV